MDGFTPNLGGGMKRGRSPEQEGGVGKQQKIELFPDLNEQQVEALLSITHRGRLRSYQHADGYGFIECQGLKGYGYERDVFVHYKELPQVVPPCGSALSFMIRKNPKGLIQAANVTVVPEDQAIDLPATEHKTETPIGDRIFSGVVKSFTQGNGPGGKGGFGFIKCDDTEKNYERDVFLHRNQLTEGPNTPRDFVVGMKLTFQVQLNARNMPQARNVKILDDQPPEVKQQMMLLMSTQPAYTPYPNSVGGKKGGKGSSVGSGSGPTGYQRDRGASGGMNFPGIGVGGGGGGVSVPDVGFTGVPSGGGHFNAGVGLEPPPPMYQASINDVPLLGLSGCLDPALLQQLNADPAASLLTALQTLAAAQPPSFAPQYRKPLPPPASLNSASNVSINASALASLAQSGLL
eukprot:TRINITY_DN3115_c0_g1_i1.p1 TRINITY_DN3115_c0_g1~~TRINITY_DN3115_c0_g1_i1.p1  ORF type:complete len:405 (+),score=87.98 TRINITY_DN3115_c0_g1_i1:67-1281(+)